ncbi:MAG: malto-oligosyltrehalose trehalohydrolase [Kofleriaceae bacterium]
MRDDSYGPWLGAQPRGESTRFALWTSRARECTVRLGLPGGGRADHVMTGSGNGLFEVEVPGVGHGARYVFVLDGIEARDPYAAFLPDGADAPASVWHSSYRWRHPPVSRPLREHVIYELHIGTFTPEGTYVAAAQKLPQLVQLGVTALELMPLGAWAGSRGWGYDVVAHYAPFAPYGTPDELRAFIDAAHELGLAVLLDVVYNHFGPSGNVLPRFGPEYFNAGERTPWGDAPNFSHPAMRRYVVRNVRHWLDEFRFDGLRFDAVHAIVDRSPRHILAEIADDVRTLVPRRLLIAEDDRNDPQILEACGFDGVWADDFHHQVRVALTRERDGYYASYTGRASDLARTIEHGWFYDGAKFPRTGAARGRPAPRAPAEAFIYCIQNHDQVGNRALGDRLTDAVPCEAVAAATMLLLFLPMTPLLFMGQEWAATTPFLYFTDHAHDLGVKVTEGRRAEFASFATFKDEARRASIPDPQAISTFVASRLNWSERTMPDRASVLALNHQMLKLRRTDPVLRGADRQHLHAWSDANALVVERWIDGDVRRLVVNLSGELAPTPRLEGAVCDPQVLASSARVDMRESLPARSALLVSYRRAGDRSRARPMDLTS